MSGRYLSSSSLQALRSPRRAERNTSPHPSPVDRPARSSTAIMEARTMNFTNAPRESVGAVDLLVPRGTRPARMAGRALRFHGNDAGPGCIRHDSFCLAVDRYRWSDLTIGPSEVGAQPDV